MFLISAVVIFVRLMFMITCCILDSAVKALGFLLLRMSIDAL